MKSAEARRLIKIFLLRAILCRRKRERRKSGDSKEEDRNEIPVGENRCACCLRPLYLGRGVRCKDCGEKSCRKGCSRFDPSDNAWRCIFCRQQRFLPARNCVEFLIQSLTQFLIFFSLLCPINLYCNLFPCKILVSFLREKRERFIE